MKNSLFLICFIALFSVNANASNVDRARAKSIAQALLNKSISDDSFAAEAKIRGCYEMSAFPEFYVFNAEDGKGFVIVSGESELPEVLAYSYDNVLNLDNMHPSLEGLLSSYSQAVQAVRGGIGYAEEYFGEDAISNNRKRNVRAASKVVEPLCKCSWGQDAPYNNLTPMINGEHCPSGCVATAMAQIMYFYQWPEVGCGKELYASGISGVGVIGSDFSQHYYDWEYMCATKGENLAFEKNASAVSQLLYDCGIATRMKYDLEGSSTNDDLAMKALYTYFGYKASKLDFLYRDSYATQDEWNEVVKSFLDSGSPVLYGGYSRSMSGHEFLIDGYDAKGLFHVNWGWNGTSNGYYSIVTLNPQGMNIEFGTMQSMVCGFEPDYAGDDKTPRQWRLYMKNPPSVAIESVELNTSFDVRLSNVSNMTYTARTWTFGVGLYDSDEKLVKVITSTKNKNYAETILSFYGVDQFDMSAKIPLGTPDGDYTLKAVFRQSGYDDFVLPDMEGGQRLNQVPLRIKNGMAYFDKAASVETANVHDVKEVSYYDLTGRKINAPAKGRVYIKKETLASGETRLTKFLGK